MTCQAENLSLHAYKNGRDRIISKDWTKPGAKFGLTGEQEAEAFKKKDFIRMHASTLAKVEFFRHVIILAQ